MVAIVGVIFFRSFYNIRIYLGVRACIFFVFDTFHRHANGSKTISPFCTRSNQCQFLPYVRLASMHSNKSEFFLSKFMKIIEFFVIGIHFWHLWGHKISSEKKIRHKMRRKSLQRRKYSLVTKWSRNFFFKSFGELRQNATVKNEELVSHS